MEEEQYRAAYRQYNQTRCVFEKAILSRSCGCRHAHKFCLAEREGIACQSKPGQERCRKFLRQVRRKAVFSLKLTQSTDALPHAKEMKVQRGSLTGLAEMLGRNTAESTIDVDELLTAAEQHCSSLENITYDQIIRAITHAPGRKRRRRST